MLEIHTHLIKMKETNKKKKKKKRADILYLLENMSEHILYYSVVIHLSCLEAERYILQYIFDKYSQQKKQ